MIKTFIIAEAGVNHNGSIKMAKELIDAAVYAKADAVKFQTFQAEKLLTEASPKADYQLEKTGSFESQYEMIKKLELSIEDHADLIDYCHGKKIQFLSTAFDLDSLHLLIEKFNLPLLKIASGEITNYPLLLKAARSNKPVVLSTGMATLGDIEASLGVLAFGYLFPDHVKPNAARCLEAYCSAAGQAKLKKYVSLLHCVTDYPAPFAAVNLKAITTLRQAFPVRVGYSDHTMGIAVAIASVARGAAIIEKHFTLDKTLAGPDHAASLEPHELAAMVQAIREVEWALGKRQKMPQSTEFKNRLLMRKSIVALSHIKKGDLFTEKNIGLKRPGNGIEGLYLWDWLDKMASRDYIENELITEK